MNRSKPSQFDFSLAISQLFAQEGGRNFTFRLVMWAAALMGVGFAFIAKPYLGMMGKIIDGAWQVNKNGGDPDAIIAAYGGIGAFVLPVLFFSLVLWAVYASAETALHKRVLKNIDHGFFPLRFGKAELRVMATQFIVYFLCMLALIAIELLMIALIAGAAFAGQGNILFGIIIGIFAVISVVAFFVVPIHIAVRLAPGAAISVKEERFSPLAGWAITKGRTGYLFLAYLFLFIAGYVVISIIQLSVMGLVFSENYMFTMMGYSEQNPQEIFSQIAEKLKQPKIIFAMALGLILYLIFSMTWWLSICGIGAYALKWWKHDQSATGAEVFD